MQCFKLFDENVILYQSNKSRSYFVMSKPPIELSLVKIELPSKTLVYYITPNGNKH